MLWFPWTLSACDGIDYGFQDPDEEAPPEVWVEETLHQGAAPPVDVLFVVDGTGSMAEEQMALAAAANDFVAALEGERLAWQVGVTSTDPADGGALAGRPWILTPGAEAPGAALAAALEVGADRPPPSAGLDAVALALADAQGLNVGFRREGAALHVVFVSDGDDESGAVLGADPVTAFLDLLQAQADWAGQPAWASAVVGDAPSGCDGETGSAQAGTRYLAVAAATGGSTASICALDFGPVAAALSALSGSGSTRFALQATPAEGTVTVEVAGERVTAYDVDYDEPAVVFTVAPAAEVQVTVKYRLAESS